MDVLLEMINKELQQLGSINYLASFFVYCVNTIIAVSIIAGPSSETTTLITYLSGLQLVDASVYTVINMLDNIATIVDNTIGSCIAGISDTSIYMRIIVNK